MLGRRLPGRVSRRSPAICASSWPAGRAPPRRLRGSARPGPAARPQMPAAATARSVRASARRGLLTVGAGDNVVRLLPPLIIEAKHVERGDRHDRGGLHGPARPAGEAQGGLIMPATNAAQPRHFLDLDRFDTRDPARDPRRSASPQEGRAAERRVQAARRQDAGDDLREAVDAHARLVRGRHAPARRRRGDPRRATTRSSAAARRSPTPRACCRATVDAIMLRTSRRRRSCSSWRDHAHGAGDQRPHRPHASLPADGRRDDVRGASRPDRRHASSPGRATATTWRPRGSTPRRGSISSCASPARSSCSRRRTCSTGRGARAPRCASSTDPDEAVRGADCVVTDTWVVDGGRCGGHARARRATTCCAPYRVDERLMAAAKPGRASSCTACPPIAARR